MNGEMKLTTEEGHQKHHHHSGFHKVVKGTEIVGEFAETLLVEIEYESHDLFKLFNNAPTFKWNLVDVCLLPLSLFKKLAMAKIAKKISS